MSIKNNWFCEECDLFYPLEEMFDYEQLCLKCAKKKGHIIC